MIKGSRWHRVIRHSDDSINYLTSRVTMSHPFTVRQTPATHLCTVISTNSNKAVAILFSRAFIRCPLIACENHKATELQHSKLNHLPRVKTKRHINCYQEAVTVAIKRQWLTLGMVFSRGMYCRPSQYQLKSE